MCGAQLLVPIRIHTVQEQLYEVTANHTVTRIYLSSVYYQKRFSFYGYNMHQMHASIHALILVVRNDASNCSLDPRTKPIISH